MGKIVEFKAVGMTFRQVDGENVYPANLLRLADEFEARQFDDVRGTGSGSGDVAIPLVLIRDPDNEHDPNAVEIHAPALGRGDIAFIGFVPAWLAEKLAPTIDRGDVWEARLDRVLISPDHPDKPGAQVILERVSQVADVPV